MNSVTVLMTSLSLALMTMAPGVPVEKGGRQQVSLEIQGDSLQYPVAEATHRTSQVEATVSCSGGMGLYNGSDPSFVFPAGSEISYLFSADIWVGGVVGEDTAVSTSARLQFLCDQNHWAAVEGQELYPPSSHYDYVRHLRPMQSSRAGTAFRTESVDTFTLEHGLQGFCRGPERLLHRPLGISVVQKSYTVDQPPYDKILLLDYTISNISGSPINEVWLGIFLDPDCYNYDSQNYEGWQDDLVGSLRDISSGYGIDNDGDPHAGKFLANQSAVNAIGLRPVRVYPHVSDTNFNWWVWSYDLESDFGPRLRPAPDDPWYELNCGSTGSPQGDGSRYYILSHDEWDYDLFRTATIDSSDSIWTPPPPAGDLIGKGTDARLFMSVGPLDLSPEVSMRAVWAVFAGEWVHTDPNNGANLYAGRPDDFYRNLHFDIFRQTAARAVAMTHDIIDPTDSPTGLEVTRVSGDSAWIQWDPWVFPDVTGYHLTFEPIIPSDQWTAGSLRVNANTRRVALTGLPPGVPFVARVRQSTTRGQSDPSPPVLFGCSNDGLSYEQVMPVHRHVLFDPGLTEARLSWEPPAGADYQYYRIYRTTDSAVAASRFAAFVSDRPDTVAGEPTRRYMIGDTEYGVYQMSPCDSVSRHLTSWVDRNPIANSWYWVTGVLSGPFEGQPSSLIPCQAKPPPPGRELLVVLAGNGQYDYADSDSVEAFYRRVLNGFDFEFYYYADSLSRDAVDPTQLSHFQTILIEEGTGGTLFLGGRHDHQGDLLALLADAGLHIIYFGFPPGREPLNYLMDVDAVGYERPTFEHLYLGLDSTVSRALKTWYSGEVPVSDTLAGFRQAAPIDPDWPALHYDTTNCAVTGSFTRLLKTDSCLPFTPAFYPSEQARVIYTYGSAWPATSHLHGLPCGVEMDHAHGRAHVFSFHLWGIREDQARLLIQELLNRPAAHPSPALVPESFEVRQNYPNPFNSGTTISFTLPAWSPVTLEIYNVLGRKVRTLLDGQVLSDEVTHTIQWDGTGSTGEAVSTGVYFYRLRANDQVETRKMVLVR